MGFGVRNELAESSSRSCGGTSVDHNSMEEFARITAMVGSVCHSAGGGCVWLEWWYIDASECVCEGSVCEDRCQVFRIIGCEGVDRGEEGLGILCYVRFRQNVCVKY